MHGDHRYQLLSNCLACGSTAEPVKLVLRPDVIDDALTAGSVGAHRTPGLEAPDAALQDIAKSLIIEASMAP